MPRMDWLTVDEAVRYLHALWEIEMLTDELCIELEAIGARHETQR